MTRILERIHSTQGDNINRAGELLAGTIAGGGRVYLFGIAGACRIWE